jgi:hypothetical protein
LTISVGLISFCFDAPHPQPQGFFWPAIFITSFFG